MRGLAVVLFVSAAVSVVSIASPAQADKPMITTSLVGRDLEVVVTGVTEYCLTDAKTDILRTRESIRIVRERPHRVSHCIGTRELKFVIHDVDAGTYAISYEQVPLVAPARPLRIAWTTAFVRE